MLNNKKIYKLLIAFMGCANFSDVWAESLPLADFITDIDRTSATEYPVGTLSSDGTLNVPIDVVTYDPNNPLPYPTWETKSALVDIWGASPLINVCGTPFGTRVSATPDVREVDLAKGDIPRQGVLTVVYLTQADSAIAQANSSATKLGGFTVEGTMKHDGEISVPGTIADALKTYHINTRRYAAVANNPGILITYKGTTPPSSAQPASATHVIAHELGHVMGLNHHAVDGSVMKSQGSSSNKKIDPELLGTLATGHHWCSLAVTLTGDTSRIETDRQELATWTTYYTNGTYSGAATMDLPITPFPNEGDSIWTYYNSIEGEDKAKYAWKSGAVVGTYDYQSNIPIATGNAYMEMFETNQCLTIATTCNGSANSATLTAGLAYSFDGGGAAFISLMENSAYLRVFGEMTCNTTRAGLDANCTGNTQDESVISNWNAGGMSGTSIYDSAPKELTSTTVANASFAVDVCYDWTTDSTCLYQVTENSRVSAIASLKLQ